LPRARAEAALDTMPVAPAAAIRPVSDG
jgi:hypothetical protein